MKVNPVIIPRKSQTVQIFPAKFLGLPADYPLTTIVGGIDHAMSSWIEWQNFALKVALSTQSYENIRTPEPGFFFPQWNVSLKSRLFA